MAVKELEYIVSNWLRQRSANTGSRQLIDEGGHVRGGPALGQEVNGGGADSSMDVSPIEQLATPIATDAPAHQILSQYVHHRPVKRQLPANETQHDNEEGDLEEEDAQFEIQAESGQSKQNVLVRLFEETYVSLRASGCLETLDETVQVSTNSTLSSGSGTLENKSGQSWLCLIDEWSSARILQANGTVLWPRQDASSDQVDTREPILDYLTTDGPDNQQQHQDHQDQQQQHQLQHTQSAFTSAHSNQSVHLAAAKLAYTSASSVISFLGILANLLIFLIIVINTKKKCPNFLSRTSQASHTNYHFVLLFQLTLTGLLLGSYVLFNTTLTFTNGAGGGHHLDPESSLSPLSFYLVPPDNLNPFDSMRQEAQEQAQISILLRLAVIENDDQQRPKAYAVQGNPTRVSRLVSNDRIRCQYRPDSSSPKEDDNDDNGREDKPRVSLAQLTFDLITAIHIWTVAALAYDRYCAIAYPLEYLRAVGTARAKTFLLMLWLGAFLVVVLLPLAVDLLESWADRSPGGLSRTNELIRLLAGNCSGSRGDDLDSDRSYRLVNTLTNLWSLDAVTKKNEQGDGHPPLHQKTDRKEMAEIVQLILSCLTFLTVVVAPLVIVTTCNMSIYDIVKGHERRLSASSGSQQPSNYGGGGGGGVASTSLASFRHNLANNLALFRRDASFCSSSADHQELAIYPPNNTSDTLSSASSIFGKLIRVSHQVGASLACERSSTSSASSASSGQHDVSSLIVADEHNRHNSHEPDSQYGGRPNDAQTRRREFAVSKSDRSSLRSTEGGLQSCGEPEAANLSTQQRLDSLGKLIRRRQGQSGATRDLWPSQKYEQHGDVAGSPGNFLQRKKKLKRKLSDNKDHGQLHDSQADEHQTLLTKNKPAMQSTDDQQQIATTNDKRLSFDTCSCHSGRSVQSATMQQQCSTVIPPSRQNAGLLDSDGIMRQLKLAGLSFAGIAINELMMSDGKRALNRSSSCSLGNIANSFVGLSNGTSGGKHMVAAVNILQQQQRNFGVHNQVEKRSSYVSLANYNGGQTRKYSTRLLNADLDSIDSIATNGSVRHNQEPIHHDGNTAIGCCSACNWQAASCQLQHHHHHRHHRHPSSGFQLNSAGTNNRMQFNVVFNVVVWLILALLICSLPHYCLMLFLRISEDFNTSSERSESRDEQRTPESILDHLVIAKGPGESQETDRHLTTKNWYLIRMSFLWLTCLCRILFILMLPLNAWLYGIRSRSLKTTLRMMLRKYISKKQASIEIDQRRKSVMTMRSRESSIAGGGGCSQQTASCRCKPSHQYQQHFHNAGRSRLQQQQQPDGSQSSCNRHSGQADSRIVRRCASFNLPISIRHQQDDANPVESRKQQQQPGITMPDATSNSAAIKSHSSSIRFVLGDNQATHLEEYKHDNNVELEKNVQYGLFDCLNLPAVSGAAANRQAGAYQTSSLNSSLASSSKSLLSASIRSSQSAALLLLNPALGNFDSVKTTTAVATSGQKTAATTAAAAGRGELPPPPMSVLKSSKRGSRPERVRHQESCESACPEFTSSSRQPKPILVRVKSSPGKLVPGRLINPAESCKRLQPQEPSQVLLYDPMDGPTDQKQQKHQAPDPMSDSTRSSSSDIKFLLTAVEDKQETSQLLPACNNKLPLNEAILENCSAQAEDTTRNASQEQVHRNDLQAQLQQSLIKRPANGELQQQRQQQQQDYYRQIKGAITRYFASLELKRRPAQLAERRRCFCCSSEFESSSDRFAWRDVPRKNPELNGSQLSLELSGQSEVDQMVSATSNERQFCRLHSRSLSLRRASLDCQQQRLLARSALVASCRRKASKRWAIVTHTDSVETDTSSQSHSRTSCSVAASSSSLMLDSSVALSLLRSNRQQIDLDKKNSLQKDSMKAISPSIDKQNPNQQQEMQCIHLKPPNSLNLMFNPPLGTAQGGQTLYSSLLALSPIKECSSNHSCASSQSSLNIVSQSTSKQLVRVEVEDLNNMKDDGSSHCTA